MAKVLRCRGGGMDCGFVAHGESEDEVMQQAAEHVRAVHHMEEVTPDVAEQVRVAMRTEEE